MVEISLSEWNGFITNHPNAHLLQMGEWGELKKDFGWKPVHIISENIGAQILFRKLPLGLTIGYMPKPVFSNQLSVISNEFWNEVDSICKKNKAVFLKIEPDAWDKEFILHPSSFILSKHNIQPPRTIIIDIKEDEETILAEMKQKCRYNIRLAEKKGVTVRAWDDISAFHQMMLITGGRDNFGVHSKEYYQRAYDLFHPQGICELLVAEFEGKPLASLMVFVNGSRAWYVYGASNNEERNRMPTYLLQWEAIRWAKSKGCEKYDLWGVPDEDEATLEAQFESRHDGLWGVYRFKRGFGGQLKRAAQALDKVYNPLLYKLYLLRSEELMSNILKSEIPCKTAKGFLDIVLPSNKYFGERIEKPTWLFRGQGYDYELKPSIFRKDKNSIENLKQLTDRNIENSYEQLLLAERDFIYKFFFISDTRGFLIPDDSQELRSKLAEFRMHDFHVTQENGEWLSSGKLLSLVSMAQHYGIPTRLLDWTLNPLTAAFFAAESGINRFNTDKNKLKNEDVIVFWAFYFPWFGVDLHYHTKDYSLKGVTAPSASNPNLKAQQGVFTLTHHWYTNETENDYLPFDKILEKISKSPYSKDVLNCELHKITLPVTESYNLFNLLSKLGISSSSIYPGYHSIVDDLKMQKGWEEFAKG